jgi:hypothetical protein
MSAKAFLGRQTIDGTSQKSGKEDPHVNCQDLTPRLKK